MSADPQPEDGVTGLLRRFDEFPIVALGEMHGIEQGARFLLNLVRHPAFSARAHAIVVEFGNAHHQAIADRYVAGEDVSLRDMQRIWRDVVGAVPWGLRRAIYPEFFAAVRAVNEQLPPARRVRVLLGDPPVDWPNVRSPDDLHPAMLARDEHFAGVVEREVLARGQRALLLSGGQLELYRKIKGVLTRVIPFGGSAVTLAELADAYLYLGPAAAYTWSKAELTPDDDDDRVEVERRAALFV